MTDIKAEWERMQAALAAADEKLLAASRHVKVLGSDPRVAEA